MTGRWQFVGRLVGRTDVELRHELFSVRGRSIAWLFPLALLGGIAAVDVTTGAFQVISWTVLVPGIAAAICGVWATAALAVLAVLVYLLADTFWQVHNNTGLPGLVLVLLGGVIAVVASSVRVRGEERMLHMRDIADTTRRTVLRPIPQGWGGLDHAAVYLAADTEARVGGDFYDIQLGPHGTRVLIGDVQGKGLGAVETASALLGTFRETGYHEADLRTVAERLDQRLLRHRQHSQGLGYAEGDGDRFATAVLVGFSEDLPDEVDAVVFGHEPPLVVGPNGVRRLGSEAGLPLGMADIAPSVLPPVCRVALAHDETLLLMTDGVTEARDPEGRFYQPAEDIVRALAADPDGVVVPQRLVALVRDGTLRHCRGLLVDDTTIFAVRRVAK
ncbi:PP2C family protein-serine/threonine phosphatase [Streptomyces sp. SCSIO 75703]|uniref:PP2C family protein-serine/threonine phosphatase n=1 Tax=unclassified Streptomyces TaxID=2593676 RepID=UPI0004C16C83|nr:PP2C family protein-serine/threonine phosphatase [Streptomyces sp. NRRL F-5065]